MATVKPFRALRPQAAAAAEFASLPYDVMDAAEAREMVAQKPQSFLRVTRAEVDLPENTDAHAAVVYEQAGKKMAEYVQSGLLLRDETPCYYVYQQQMGDNVQTGIAATCTVEEYEAGIVRKHELTRPDKEQDRVDHILGSGAQTGPVFLVYRRNEDIADLAATVTALPPTYNFTAEDGIRHSLWVVADPAVVGGIEAAFETVGRLYIADGHHRAAAAARVSRLSDGPNAGRFLTVLFRMMKCGFSITTGWSTTGALRRRKRSWKRSDKSSLSNRCAVVAMKPANRSGCTDLACISMAPGTN